MEREGKEEEREREKEKSRFREIAQFWELGSDHGAQQSFEKIPSQHYREAGRRRSRVSTPFLCS